MRDKPSKPADPKDPLSAQGAASRVEKLARPKKEFKDLPSWYHRLRALVYHPRHGWDFHDIQPGDFDEDISDFGTDDDPDWSDDDYPPGCECDLELGCECDWPSEEEEDLSEAPYDGPEAHLYFHLNDLRFERKRDRWESRLHFRDAKARAIEEDRKSEQEHLDGYEGFKKEQQKELEASGKKKRKRTRLGDLRGQAFRTCCTDYVDCFGPSRHIIEFEEFDKDGHEPGMTHGRMAMGDVGMYSVFEFPTPKYPSRRAVAVKLEGTGPEMFIKFLGNGYIKVKIPREYAVRVNRYADEYPRNLDKRDVPEVFKFIGAKFDLKKETQEREEAFAAMRARERSSSPVVSWGHGYRYGIQAV
ncbi:hypothetical protein QBC37DRAFT_432694 [Rhypophila decipiens]|uniref:Uncharacterized protein n=1 Tax=Rhypophila decipiens TaxID=261697 RepID=A0AAN6XWE5_9PEZI|nr:hypothetical protein QBC37DRAFT_432694 [Rhypophila decipiens]